LNFYCRSLKTMCHFRNLKLEIQNSEFKAAFSLVETVTALIILSIVTSSVLVVMDRCVSSTADLAIRRQAFEVARDNMETVLTSTSVSDKVEMGTSDKYPQIRWQTAIEPFYEPITDRIWVQVVCSAEYTDTEGEQQTVELTHWLTGLTKEQLLQMLQQHYEQLAEDQLLETVEEAADYVGVDAETIQQWVQNGMPLTSDGRYIKDYLDLYVEYDGNPSAEAKSQVRKEIMWQNRQQEQEPQKSQASEPETEPSAPDEEDTQTVLPDESPSTSQCDGLWICGKCYPNSVLRNMDFGELWQLVMSDCE
jgi:hypothetical protein